jgi:HprK-related kinase B
MPVLLDTMARDSLADRAMCAELSIRVGDCEIAIESTSRELIEWLRAYYGSLVCARRAPSLRITAVQAEIPPFPVAFADWPRDAGKVGRKDAFADVGGGRVVRKVRTGMQFLISPEHRIAIGDCLTHANQVVNFVNSQHIAWLMARGYVLCHAAGVVAGDAGFAIAGMSGGGKSTLALHLIRRGLSYTSNDRLMIRGDAREARMAGIAKSPRINPGTALCNPDLRALLTEDRQQALAELDEDALWDLEEKYDVPIETLYGPGRTVLDAPLRGLLVLAWQREGGAPTEIRRVAIEERPELLAAVMKGPGPFVVEPAEAVRPQPPESYHRALASVAVFEARGRLDFEHAARVCESFLAAGVHPAGGTCREAMR